MPRDYSSAAAPFAPPRAARILIVDDEPGLRDVVHEWLEDHGYEVLEAEDGRDALALLERERVDVIILDMMMPRLDGAGFLAELCELGIDPPIIAISGGGELLPSKVPLALAGRMGARVTLEKPFDFDDLLAHVAACLDDDS
jgi:DNA-binding response OmpR family regulator